MEFFRLIPRYYQPIPHKILDNSSEFLARKEFLTFFYVMLSIIALFRLFFKGKKTEFLDSFLIYSF